MWRRSSGIRRPKGRLWDTNRLRELLTSPRVAGLRQNGDELVEADWPAIIPRDEWEQLRAILGDAPTAKGPKEPRAYLGSGTYICDLCGTPMLGQARMGTPAYACRREKGGCGRLHRMAAPLDDYLRDEVLDALASPKFRAKLEAIYGAAGDDVAAELVAKRDGALARLKQLRDLAGDPGVEFDVDDFAGRLSFNFNIFGSLFEQGRGVAKDPKQAVQWYRRAAGLKAVAFEVEPPTSRPAAATAQSEASPGNSSTARPLEGPPPVIHLLEPVLAPARGATLGAVTVPASADRLLVLGRVAAPRGVKTLTVNGRPETVDSESLFTAEIAITRSEEKIEIVATDQQEVVHRTDPDFETRAGIWAAVAASRGHQMVADGAVSEPERWAAEADYRAWLRDGAESHVQYLLAVEGVRA